MFYSKEIIFSEEATDGVLQYMKNNAQTDKISYSYSSINNAITNILTLDDNYAYTNTNKTTNSNYFSIELTDRILYPKGYVIRSYKHVCCSYLRSWSLYGSLIGFEWTLLHEINEKDDLKSGNIGRYKLSGGPYKFFKIVQTGPNYGSSDSDKYRLRLSYIDLFGLMTNKERIGARTCRCKKQTNHILFIVSLIYS